MDLHNVDVTAIQLRNNLKSWYLELSFCTLEKGWHWKWFYLSGPFGSFLANSTDRLGPMAPPSWNSILEGPTLEVTEGILNQVTTLKDARVTDWMVLHVFLLRHVLPQNVRLALMWEYIGLREQFMVIDGHLPKESLTRVAWTVLVSMLGKPSVNDSLAPFSMFDPRPDDLPFLGEVSVPLALGARRRRGHLMALSHHGRVHLYAYLRGSCPLPRPPRSAPL